MKKLFLIFITYHLSLITYHVNAQYLLYGVTGAYFDANKPILHDGTIFSYNPKTNKQTDVFIFNDIDGQNPEGKLLYASDSLLYGITNAGGTHDSGTVFSFNPRTKIETVVLNCTKHTGYASHGANELIQANDSLLYGTFWSGGKYGNGVLFSYNIKTHKDSVRCNFTDSTSYSAGAYMDLWQDTASGMLYGVTEHGGFPGGGGVIYGFNPVTNQVTNYYVGQSPNPFSFRGGFTQASNGLLYAMTDGGGTPDSGTIYSFNISTHAVKMEFQFSRGYGAYPNGNELFPYSNGLLYGMTSFGGNGYGVVLSFNPSNNIEKVLHVFNDTDGYYPFGRLVEDPDNGILYGVTMYGGSAGRGVIFSYNVGTSTFTKLIDIIDTNESGATGGLTLVKDTGKKIDTGIGINQLSVISGKLSVFPNPGSGKFTLSLANITEKCSVEVYDVLGEKIYNATLAPQTPKGALSEIDLSKRANGVYFFRVVGENGRLVGSGKLIIEK